MVAWTMVPCDKSVPPQPKDLANLDEALRHVQAHMNASKFAHKERVDLAALAAHSGNKYVQVEMIPDSEFAKLRELQGTAALVLLPPDPNGKSVVGTDAVVFFYDAHGGVKGLPFNERASMICAACGTKRQVRGDCFVGRLAYSPSTDRIELGAEVAPQMITERDWLEAAQKYHASATEPGKLQCLLSARLADERRQKVAAAVAGATAAASVAASPAAEEGAPTATGSAVTVPTTDAAAVGAGEPVAQVAEGAGQMSWEDGQNEVTISIDLPAGTKSKHVRCVIKDESISVQVATLPPAIGTVVSGELFQTVKPEGCCWDLQDGKKGLRTLTITLEKAKAMRWLMLTRDTGGVV